MARNQHVRLTRIEGVTRTGRAAILVAGPDPWAYDLPRRFFRASLSENTVGDVPVWRLGSVLEELSASADVVLARVDKLSARLFFRSNYLRVPEWIDTVLTVPEDLEALARSNHSLQQDMRLARKSGLEVSVSQREEDFDEFYRSMYVPFVRARHATMARPTNEQSLRSSFRRGGIIWLTSAGERVAGLLFEQIDNLLHIWADGTRDGDVNVMKKGALSALFFCAIRQARERNCKYVHFGGCRACLSDGVLRYKRKWGVKVHVKPVNQFYMLVRWNTWNNAVATFLMDVPLLHQNAGRLTAVTASDMSQAGTQADADRIYEALRMPGIDRLVIVNASGWQPGIVAPLSTTLVGGCPHANKLLTL